MRVLVVEDGRKLGDALQSGLRGEGWAADLARTGEEAFLRLSSESFDVVVLDWMLPGRDGVTILRLIRERGAQVPVLLLTARDSVEDRVAGLDAGADDYLVTPFAFAELVARIRALLRRGRTDRVLRLRCADLDLDLVTRRADRGGRALDLTPREFDILEFLLRHRGHAVSRGMLAREVWKEPDRATPLDNVIDVHMARLRRKVDAEPARRLLHTVRGVGFVLGEEAP